MNTVTEEATAIFPSLLKPLNKPPDPVYKLSYISGRLHNIVAKFLVLCKTCYALLNLQHNLLFSPAAN